MTMITARGVRLRTAPLALLAVLTVPAVVVAGCGTQHADGSGANGPSAPAPTVPREVACPGESAAPAPPTTAQSTAPAVPPTDHYAENHGFMVPLPLHGRSRCDGLAAVGRVRSALLPLSRRGDVDPSSTYSVLSDLGYTNIATYPLGTTGVAFVAEGVRPRLCLEGELSRRSLTADAFAGYPDHTGCDRPTGGH